MLKNISVKETNIAYWIEPQTFGSHPQTLVFIHGSGSNSSAWVHQYGALHKTFNIVALNLPGHGESGGSGEAEISSYVEHVKDVMDVLKISRPVLIGHSMGAAIALCFAAKYPEYVSGVVAVGGGITMPVNPDILNGLKSAPDVVFDMICKFSIAKENRPKLFDALRANLAQANTDVLASDMRACSKVDLTELLPEIKAPTLAICGTQDKMTSPEASKQIASAIAGAEFLLIEGAGHMVMMEKPDEVNEALKTFCEKVK